MGSKAKIVDVRRRQFLKTSAIGAAGVAIGSIAVKDISAKTAEWSTGMVINPNIANTRVVCCHDPAMVSKICTNVTATNEFKTGIFPWNMANQNSAAVTKKIQDNLDAMAISLAQKTSAAEAWSTIFRSSKTWALTKVAIKVNGLGVNHPRVAIVDKLCKVLHTIGVPYANIVIYDGITSASGLYSSYVGQELVNADGTVKVGLPTDVVVSNGNTSLGGTVKAAIVGRTTTYDCTTQIANGTIDILINCAVNKGHGDEFGSCTLSMKNHGGTFAPGVGLHSGDATGYLFGFTKSNAILGGTPVRQQLVIVDSLYASVPGPSSAPTHTPARLIMGVCSPIVDYQVVKNIREPQMSATHNATVVNRFLTDFGFTATAPQWIVVSPATGTKPGNHGLNSATVGGLTVLLGSRAIPLKLNFDDQMPSVKVMLFALDGRLISQKVVDRQNGALPNTVDCSDWLASRQGARGSYVLTCSAGSQSVSQGITLE